MILLAKPDRLKKDPEKTSWKIRRNGITVMAVVVLRTIQETIRDMTSAANVMSSRVMPISTMPQGVTTPCTGILTLDALQMSRVMTVCAVQSMNW